MKECHPDIGGDEELAKEINAAADLLCRMEFTPPPVPQVVYIHVGGGFADGWFSNSSSTTSYTSTGGFYW
jgi:hypothetical protein